jgi:hypothetical protein
MDDLYREIIVSIAIKTPVPRQLDPHDISFRG